MDPGFSFTGGGGPEIPYGAKARSPLRPGALEALGVFDFKVQMFIFMNGGNEFQKDI